MSWHCPNCGVAHARQHDEPWLCDACKLEEHYLEEIARLEKDLVEARAEALRFRHSNVMLEQDVVEARAEVAALRDQHRWIYHPDDCECDDCYEWSREHGYPTAADLREIREWDCTTREDQLELMRRVCELWHWTSLASNDAGSMSLSTGGWSGNESIIEALEANAWFWKLCFVSSQRGGHYVFEVGGVREEEE